MNFLCPPFALALSRCLIAAGALTFATDCSTMEVDCECMSRFDEVTVRVYLEGRSDSDSSVSIDMGECQCNGSSCGCDTTPGVRTLTVSAPGHQAETINVEAVELPKDDDDECDCGLDVRPMTVNVELKCLPEGCADAGAK